MILLTEALLHDQVNAAIQLALSALGRNPGDHPVAHNKRLALWEQYVLPVPGKLHSLVIPRYRERTDIYALAVAVLDGRTTPVDVLWEAPFQFRLGEVPPGTGWVWLYRFTPRAVPAPLQGAPLTSAALQASLDQCAMVLEELGSDLTLIPGPCEPSYEDDYPVISSFSVTGGLEGSPVVVSWVVLNAHTVHLNGAPVAASGKQVLNLAPGNYSFELEAWGRLDREVSALGEAEVTAETLIGWDTAFKVGTTPPQILEGGALAFSPPGASHNKAIALSVIRNSGKVYWEVERDPDGPHSPQVGLAFGASVANVAAGSGIAVNDELGGIGASGCTGMRPGGDWRLSGTVRRSLGSTASKLRLALDIDNRVVYVGHSGGWYTDAPGGVGIALSGLSAGTWFVPCAGITGGVWGSAAGAGVRIRLNPSQWAHSAPPGYTSWMAT